jgi:hypothetical protein
MSTFLALMMRWNNLNNNMIITIHIRHPLLLSLFYNIIINFTSVQCLFATLHDIFFGCTCAKLYSIKRFHPSPCSWDLECAFKQNLFIPPLVHNIWMCIQAKCSHPSPCSRHLDVHSSKTFSSLPLFKDIWMCIQAKPFHPSLCSRHFACAFKQNLFIPPFVQDICMCIQAKPYLPSPQNLHANTEGLGWVFIPMSLRFACPFKWQVVSSNRTFARLRLGICSHGHEILGVDFEWKKFPPSAPWGDY